MSIVEDPADSKKPAVHIPAANGARNSNIVSEIQERFAVIHESLPSAPVTPHTAKIQAQQFVSLVDFLRDAPLDVNAQRELIEQLARYREAIEQIDISADGNANGRLRHPGKEIRNSLFATTEALADAIRELDNNGRINLATSEISWPLSIVREIAGRPERIAPKPDSPAGPHGLGRLLHPFGGKSGPSSQGPSRVA